MSHAHQLRPFQVRRDRHKRPPDPPRAAQLRRTQLRAARGWYYTSNDLNAAGPGLCTDQHVLEHLARRQRSDRTFGITAGALLIAAAPAIMAILGFTHPDQFPQPYYFIAAAAAAITAVAALIREIRKPLRVRLTTR